VLYLHCGWLKTGTTSLQTALSRHQESLARAGVVYPDDWKGSGTTAHHELADVLGRARRSDAAFDEFGRWLANHADVDVLLSTESLTNWLQTDEVREVFLRFIRSAQEVAPVTCVWSLRRFDEVAHSGYMHMTLKGMPSCPPDEFMACIRPGHWFTGMRQVADAVEGRAVYVKYDSSGTHNTDLLHAVGLPDRVVEAIDSELRVSARVYASRSHKQLAAVVNASELSARSGVPLDKRSLLSAFDRDGFRFEDERPCALVEPAVRRDLHERALADARGCDFTPYLRFFEDEQCGPFPAPTGLGPDALSAEDLGRLVSHLS
jgi:hypothetical protein